jgi:hypothetical protein
LYHPKFPYTRYRHGIQAIPGTNPSGLPCLWVREAFCLVLGEGEVRKSTVPELIDPVFAKTSSKRSFSVIENERFGLVFAKTGSINSGKGLLFLPKKSLRFW